MRILIHKCTKIHESVLTLQLVIKICFCQPYWIFTFSTFFPTSAQYQCFLFYYAQIENVHKVDKKVPCAKMYRLNDLNA